MASANKAVLAEINTWIEVMTFPETEPLQIPEPAAVVATALEHFSADFTSSPTAVEALDNIACRGWGRVASQPGTPRKAGTSANKAIEATPSDYSSVWASASGKGRAGRN